MVDSFVIMGDLLEDLYVEVDEFHFDHLALNFHPLDLDMMECNGFPKPGNNIERI